MLQGTSVSPGIGMGRAVVKGSELAGVDRRLVPADRVDEELSRFRAAVGNARAQLLREKARLQGEASEATLRILDTHVAYLEDPVFTSDVETLIVHERMNLEAAIAKVVADFDRIFHLVESEALRERAVDLRDVGVRLLRNLQRDPASPPEVFPDRAVLVARELSIVDILGLPRDRFQGIATEEGSATSHAAILARSMRIPTVTGVRGLLGGVQNDAWVIVDGVEGRVHVNPDEALRAQYGEAVSSAEAAKEAPVSLLRAPARTEDGVAVSILASCGTPSEVERATEYGMDGVGLYRTEFLYLQDRRRPPEEDVLVEHFARAADLAPGKPFTVRLLDLDSSAGVEFVRATREPNPALGVKSIRMLLREPGLFRTQLRAVLRAAVGRDVRLLVPFVAGVEEVRAVRQALFEERWDLRKSKTEARERLPVGALVEVPAAALAVRDLAREADFLVVGLDNLIQYALAADRANEGTRDPFDRLHPVILRALRKILKVAEQSDLECVLFGEVAAHPDRLPLLLGVGARRFSIAPHAFPAFKSSLLELAAAECRDLAEQAARLSGPAEVELLLQRAPRD